MKLVSVICVASLLLAYPDPDTTGELKKLEGKWQVTELVADGKAVAADELRDSFMVIDGNNYVLKGKESYRGTLRLHPNQDPKAIDTVFVDEQGKEVGTAKGIYRVKDGQLQISWREKGERPTTFESKKDSGVRAITMKRKGA